MAEEKPKKEKQEEIIVPEDKTETPVIEETPIIEEQPIVELHIRDFLIKTKAMRTEFDILENKYRTVGLKTPEEWENITKLKYKNS